MLGTFDKWLLTDLLVGYSFLHLFQIEAIQLQIIIVGLFLTVEVGVFLNEPKVSICIPDRYTCVIMHRSLNVLIAIMIAKRSRVIQF